MKGKGNMNYEEKRQAYLVISQLLADAGLNQHTIREMVEKEIYNKVDREVKNVIQRLNEQCYDGDYIEEQIKKEKYCFCTEFKGGRATCKKSPDVAIPLY